MPKTITRSTGPDGGVIDADTDPDGVSAALGLDDAEPDDDEQDPDEVDETDEGDDEDEDEGPTLADLAQQLNEQRRTIAGLKRELAERRVAGKSTAPASKGKATDSSDDGETVEQAAERGREEARLELGLERAGDRIRAALTGIIPENDLDDFVDDLRLERYVDEDGKPDADAIKALRDRQAKITRRTKVGGRSVGHARQGGGSTQKSKAEVMGDTLTALGI